MSAGTPITIGVLGVQGDFREHVAVLNRVEGVRAVVVRRPEELTAVDGVVIPGGESTTIVRLLKLGGLWQSLQEWVRVDRPIFGTCAGMIVLAATVEDTRADMTTLAAIPMTVRRNAFGRQVDSFETDLAVSNLAGGPVHAIFIRAPWAESVDPAVQVLASVEVRGEVHPVAVRHGNALATAFHPEITGDGRIHHFFVDLVRAAIT